MYERQGRVAVQADTRTYCFALGEWIHMHARRCALKLSLRCQRRPWMDVVLRKIDASATPFAYFIAYSGFNTLPDEHELSSGTGDDGQKHYQKALFSTKLFRFFYESSSQYLSPSAAISLNKKSPKEGAATIQSSLRSMGRAIST